jgi:hypothetical protein
VRARPLGRTCARDQRVRGEQTEQVGPEVRTATLRLGERVGDLLAVGLADVEARDGVRDGLVLAVEALDSGCVNPDS